DDFDIEIQSRARSRQRSLSLFSLDPMTRSRPLTMFSLGILAVLSSCATPMDFGGPYSTGLSQNDVEQIKLLVSERSDIRKPVFRIWVDRPNSALVQTGRNSHLGDVMNEFRVAKHHGRWQIVSKIDEAQVLVTAD